GRSSRAHRRGLSARPDRHRVRRRRIHSRAAHGYRAPPWTRPDRHRCRLAGRRTRDHQGSGGRRSAAAMNWRRAAAFAGVLLACLGAVLAWNRVAPAAARRIPTARVQRGRVQVTVYTSGELRAGRSMQLIAPPIGGNLQIVKLAASGEPVKADDIVVEFDTAEQSFNLEQAHFDLPQAEQEIVKADADAAVQTADDAVALLHAQYDVRRAELDTKANELVSAIQA